jgi:DNA-binding HxlR family transcriptional regulator
VTRTVFATIPPRVEYELTDLGESLWQPVEAIGEWARRHQPNIAAAQRRYDKRTEQG